MNEQPYTSIEHVPYLKLANAQRHHIVYSGPYRAITERWMIDNALHDILKNKRDKPCMVKMAQKVEIWIQPNYYGFTDRPYLTRHQMVAKEAAHSQGNGVVVEQDEEKQEAESNWEGEGGAA